jgi:hypothetical protein
LAPPCLTHQLEDLDVSAADYVKPVAVPNFKAAWDALPADTEREDDYGLGAKDGLQVRGGRGGGGMEDGGRAGAGPEHHSVRLVL